MRGEILSDMQSRREEVVRRSRSKRLLMIAVLSVALFLAAVIYSNQNAISTAGVIDKADESELAMAALRMDVSENDEGAEESGEEGSSEADGEAEEESVTPDGEDLSVDGEDKGEENIDGDEEKQAGASDAGQSGEEEDADEDGAEEEEKPVRRAIRGRDKQPFNGGSNDDNRGRDRRPSPAESEEEEEEGDGNEAAEDLGIEDDAPEGKEVREEDIEKEEEERGSQGEGEEGEEAEEDGDDSEPAREIVRGRDKQPLSGSGEEEAADEGSEAQAEEESADIGDEGSDEEEEPAREIVRTRARVPS